MTRLKTTNQERLTMTVPECAQLLGVGRNNCYERAKAGEIPSIRVGKRLLIPRAALQKWLDETRNRAAAAE